MGCLRDWLWHAQVRAVFSSSKRNVAGCMVTEGVLRKAATIVVRRGKRVVFDGPISSLRRVKEIVNEASFNEYHSEARAVKQ